MNSLLVAKLLSSAVDQFVDRVRETYSAQSVTAYVQALQLFLTYLREVHDVKVAAAIVGDLALFWGTSFLDYLQVHRSIETEHLYTRVLLQFWRFVEDTFQVHVHSDMLSAYFEMNRRPKSHLVPAISAEHITSIVEAATDFQPTAPDGTVTKREYLGSLRDKAFLLTLAYTGLRVSEICELRKHQFNQWQGQLSLEDNLALDLPSAVTTALSIYLSKRGPLDQKGPANTPLFARHDKRASNRVLPISRWTGANIVESWVRYTLNPSTRTQLDSQSMTITPQSFRHYFVLSVLAQTEHNIAAAQRLARHGDRSTTRRYIQSQKLGKRANENSD